MRQRIIRALLVLMVAAFGVSIGFAGPSVLSKAQEAVISKATAKSSAGDRALVAGWSDGKKLAEFFCSDLGIKEIAKQHKGVDRLFLGSVDSGGEQFKLEGNSHLSGSGTVRIGADWKDLTFECVIDPDKAVATSFIYKIQ